MKVRSAIRPKEMEVIGNDVLIASNITPYEEHFDDHVVSGFEYDYNKYNKDEYLLQQQTQINNLAEELQAAKILLGVD